MDNDKYRTSEKGINIIGYSRAEMGIGEACRISGKALLSVNADFGVINIKYGNASRHEDLTLISKEIGFPKYNTNLIHMNPPEMPIVYNVLGADLWENRYTICSWAWELMEFPEVWSNSFRFANEIWVGSKFIFDAISKKSPIPVTYIPYAIEVNCTKQITRKEFNLPENRFLFLTMYDVNSTIMRKNPDGVIRAFKRAFKSDDENVGLIIKINNSKFGLMEVFKLKELAKDYKNIYFIDCTLTREEINALLNVSDCFVSLHRSEGFGLGLAEAMYLGKTVIGTNWSGNTDFMNDKNSCLVDYNLVKIDKDYGPYKSHQYWAEPNIEHASEYMKKVVMDKAYCKSIALEGQKTIKEKYSIKKIGEMMINRLKNLDLL